MNNLRAGKASRLLEGRDSNLAPQLKGGCSEQVIDQNWLEIHSQRAHFSQLETRATNVSAITKVQTTNESKISCAMTN